MMVILHLIGDWKKIVSSQSFKMSIQTTQKDMIIFRKLSCLENTDINILLKISSLCIGGDLLSEFSRQKIKSILSKTADA